MIIVNSPTYLQEVAKLSKKRNNSLYSCDADVMKEIKRYTIDALWASDMKIREGDGFKVLKVRCRNSVLKYSKPAGFRFLIIVSRESGRVYLLTVYPKKGKFAISNLNTAEITRILGQFAADKAAGKCEQIWPVLKPTATPTPTRSE